MTLASDEDVREADSGRYLPALRVGFEVGSQRRLVGLGEWPALLGEELHLLQQPTPHDDVAPVESEGLGLAHQDLLVGPAPQQGGLLLRGGRCTGAALEVLAQAAAQALVYVDPARCAAAVPEQGGGEPAHDEEVEEGLVEQAAQGVHRIHRPRAAPLRVSRGRTAWSIAFGGGRIGDPGTRTPAIRARRAREAEPRPRRRRSG